jgi:hypothetical protein
MNPFKPNSTSYHDYEILKDLQWHCTKCELRSGQAKTWQTWRDAYGLQFEESSPGSRRWESRVYCKTCDKTTVHRKLRTLEISEVTSARSGISTKTANRIKKLRNYEEAVLLRKLSPRELEVDHKFPQIRWNKDEESNDDNASDEYLISKFILLNRNNNLLKSRNCERCYQTNKRGNFPGIYFWYEGDEHWRTDPHDEKGCIGCFWYDPYKWREELNKIIVDS